MIAVIISAFALQAAADPGALWATFSKSPALRLGRTTVDIGTLGYDRDKKRLEYWLRRTVTRKGASTVDWADSRTCDAVRPMLNRMQGLTPPRIDVPGYSNKSEIILDGIGYSLKVPSVQGTLTFNTNVRSSLAQWVEMSLKNLEGCWTSRMPARIE